MTRSGHSGRGESSFCPLPSAPQSRLDAGRESRLGASRQSRLGAARESRQWVLAASPGWVQRQRRLQPLRVPGTSRVRRMQAELLSHCASTSAGSDSSRWTNSNMRRDSGRCTDSSSGLGSRMHSWMNRLRFAIGDHAVIACKTTRKDPVHFYPSCLAGENHPLSYTFIHKME